MFDLRQIQSKPFIIGASAGIAVAAMPWALKSLGVLLIGVYGYRYLRSSMLSIGGLLVLWYVVAAVFSGVVNDVDNIILAKYSFMFLGFVSLSTVSYLDQRKQASLMIGLVLSGILYCLYFSFFLDWSSFVDPLYRGDRDYDVFIGLTGAVIAIYSLEMLLFKRPNGILKYCLYGCFVYGLAFPVIMKSRGITLAVLLALIYLLVLKYKHKKTLGTLLLTLSSVICWQYWTEILEFADYVSHMFSLFGGDRDIRTGTGRFVVWEYSIMHLWPKNPYIGIGPDENYRAIMRVFPISGTHNALIAALVDLGIFGFIPMLFLIISCVYRPSRKLNRMVGYPIFIIGLEGIMNENLFFTFGNPGSIIILISVGMLLNKRYENNLIIKSKNKNKLIAVKRKLIKPIYENV